MPVYGKGENVRDWLFVDDHARALWIILNGGREGNAITWVARTTCGTSISLA